MTKIINKVPKGNGFGERNEYPNKKSWSPKQARCIMCPLKATTIMYHLTEERYVKNNKLKTKSLDEAPKGFCKVHATL